LEIGIRSLGCGSKPTLRVLSLDNPSPTRDLETKGAIGWKMKWMSPHDFPVHIDLEKKRLEFFGKATKVNDFKSARPAVVSDYSI
jgi:hypothetical protein